MDQPSHSWAATIYAVVVFTCIGFSICNFVASSLPSLWEKKFDSLEGIEDFCVAIFTLDYVGKLICTEEKRWKWALRPMNLIDVISILPFYIELIVSATATDASSLSSFVVLRVMLLFRVFRILKTAKYSTLLLVVGETLKRSLPGLGLLLFSCVICMVLFGSLIFYAEQTISTFDYDQRVWMYDNGNVSFFQSIPQAFWWVIVTITTVGYGDLYPVSGVGKAVGGFTVLCGLLVIAFPMTIISMNFNQIMEEEKVKKILAEAEDGPNAEKLAHMFSRTELLSKVEVEMGSLKLISDSLTNKCEALHDTWVRLNLLMGALKQVKRSALSPLATAR